VTIAHTGMREGNMKTKFLLLITFALALIIGIGLFAITKPSNNVVSVSKESFKEETSEYNINIEYPQISGLKNVPLQNVLNEKFKPNLENIRMSVLDYREVYRNLSAEQLEGVGKSEEKKTFETRFASQNLISISFEHSGYDGSSAHGGQRASVINYDLTTGKEIQLKDLFKKDSKYLQTISDFYLNDLASRFEGNDNIPGWPQPQIGAAPEENNFTNFVLTKDDLVILFNPYQVAPGAYGIQEIKIPYANLSNIINQKVLLNGLLHE